MYTCLGAYVCVCACMIRVSYDRENNSYLLRSLWTVIVGKVINRRYACPYLFFSRIHPPPTPHRQQLMSSEFSFSVALQRLPLSGMPSRSALPSAVCAQNLVVVMVCFRLWHTTLSCGYVYGRSLVGNGYCSHPDWLDESRSKQESTGRNTSLYMRSIYEIYYESWLKICLSINGFTYRVLINITTVESR